MNNLFYISVAVLAATALAACGHQRHDMSASVAPPCEVIRLDSAVSSIRSADDAGVLVESSVMAYPLAIMAHIEADTSASLPDYLLHLSESPAYNIFGPDVAEVFPSGLPQSSVYSQAAHNAHSSLKEIIFPDTLFTIISPYRQSVIVTPGRIFIALNHFLGSDYPGYDGWPEQTKRAAVPERIPVAAVEALIRSSDVTGKRPYGTTLSAVLFHEGAISYATSVLMPDVDTGLILGFTPDEMKWLRTHERQLWNELVVRDMLFSTDRAVISRSLDRLQTGYNELISGAPVGAARYIGLRIAEEYSKNNPETSLYNLLSWDLATSDDLLLRSSYQP